MKLEDYKIENGLYKRWEEKRKCCLRNNITIINREDIKPYIKYVKDKYGKDFIKLYE